MTTRRRLLTGAAGLAGTIALPRLGGAEPFRIDPMFLPRRVAVRAGFEYPQLVISTPERFLYWMDGPETAIRYGVGVGQEGLAFEGTAEIGAKREWPSWTPTPDMIARKPEAYAKYADGMPGGPNNPLGARALYLFRNGGDTLFRIHGTNQPQSIGTNSSNGCIRMSNSAVIDLYRRVPLGTSVKVIQG